MPSAHATLFFLATFLALWGLSLIIRGSVGNKSKARRLCPACDAPLTDKQSLTCPACSNTAPSEQALLRPRRSPLLIITGITAVLAAAASAYCGNYVAQWSTGRSPATIQFTLWNSIAAGLAVFWTSLLVWAWRGERSRGRKRCPRCWYDMQGATTLLCPECGHEPASPRDLFRPRRRRKLAALALVALLSAPAAWMWPRYEKYGPIGLIPTTVLIAGFEHLPERFVAETRWMAGFGPKPSGALSTRIAEDSLWQWQKRWLDTRARRVWMTSDDYKILMRVRTVRSPRGADEHRRIVDLVARRLALGNNADRVATADFVLALAYSIDYGVADDLIEPHAPALTELTACGVQPIELAAAYLLWRSKPRHDEALPIIIRVAAANARYRYLGIQTLRSTLSGRDGLRLIEPFADSTVVAERTMLAHTLYLGSPMPNVDRPRAAALLRRLFNDPDPGVVAAAASNLVFIPGAREEIVQAVRTRMTPDLLQVLATSYQLDLSPYAPDFLSLMSSPDAMTRDRASKCLGMAINQGAPFEPLRSSLESLRQSSNPDAAAAAAILLDSRPLPAAP